MLRNFIRKHKKFQCKTGSQHTLHLILEPVDGALIFAPMHSSFSVLKKFILIVLSAYHIGTVKSDNLFIRYSTYTENMTTKS